jgi:hypothetical protein
LRSRICANLIKRGKNNRTVSTFLPVFIDLLQYIPDFTEKKKLSFLLNNSNSLWEEYFLPIRSFSVLNELNSPLFTSQNLKIRRRFDRHNNIRQNRKLFPIKCGVKLQNTQIMLQGEQKLPKRADYFLRKASRVEGVNILLLIFVCLKGVDVKHVL